MWPPKDSEEYKIWIKHLSEAHKGIRLSEEHKKKLSVRFSGENNPQYGNRGKDNHNFGSHRSNETRQRQSDAAKGKQKSEEHRKNLSESHKLIFIGEGNPFHGKHHSVKSKKQMSESHKGTHSTEEQRKKISAFHKNRLKDPILRKAMSERMMGEKSHLWKGGISFAPYCFKFNRPFKSRARAFFNYTCVECGTPETKEKHTVHHINYDKEVCCNKGEPIFILLCRSCNTRANFNRDYWEQHFTEMIMGYYEGKCYFTKEEMFAYSNIET